jgi:homogentisate 1,2-dioxygenase
VRAQRLLRPAAHLYRRHASVGWTRLEGPLRPRAHDTRETGLPTGSDCLAARLRLLGTAAVQLHLAGPDAPAAYLVRNADPDELIFIHLEAGPGQLETDFGSAAYGPADYLLLPRGVADRLLPASPTRTLEVEAFSRTGMAQRMLTFHPQGIQHGPQPGACERAIRATRTEEVAVMLDTRPPSPHTARIRGGPR